MYYNDSKDAEWRSVCDDYWTDVDGNVACEQLGFLPYCKYHYLSHKCI